jgi:hypothetical protein
VTWETKSSFALFLEGSVTNLDGNCMTPQLIVVSRHRFALEVEPLGDERDGVSFKLLYLLLVSHADNPHRLLLMAQIWQFRPAPAGHAAMAAPSSGTQFRATCKLGLLISWTPRRSSRFLIKFALLDLLAKPGKLRINLFL